MKSYEIFSLRLLGVRPISLQIATERSLPGLLPHVENPPAYHIATKRSARGNDEMPGVYVLRTFRCLGAASSLRRLDRERSDAALRSTREFWAGRVVDEPAGEPEIKAALRFDA
jgi:hypothetical protein